jgi:hypothetical protein
VSRSAGAAPGCLSVTPGRPGLARCCAFLRRRGAGSLTRLSVRERLTWFGPLRRPGCPPGVAGGVPRRLGRSAAGCRRGGVLVSVGAGVGPVCESVVVRGARPRVGGRAGGVRGTGETGLWGVSRVPRYLHFPPAGESGAVCVHCRAERGAPGTFPGHQRWFLLALSPVIRAAGRPVLLCSFPGHSCGRYRLQCGFGLVPPGVSYSRSRDGGSLTSVTSRLGVGVRSGKRRRHAASTSVQAAGGSSRNRCAQRPHARAWRYTAAVRVMF